ncbi:SAF domain-containing protein [Kocuria sp. CPCC 205268]|uniref:SAF domain-containing protein n=1 Tax=Kocuria oxytropis TaxID=3058913 RepID=UPI0034D6D6C6
MSPRPRPVRRRYPLSLRLRSVLSRRRRLVAALLLGLAVGLVVLRLGPPRGSTVPVVTAAEALPAGAAVSPERLAVASYPPDLVPEGAVADPAVLAGRVLAGAAGPGQPLTESALVGPGLLTGQARGVTAVTLRIDDPGALRHVRAGDHVDVVHLPDGAAPGERQVLGRGLPVLWVSSADPVGDAGLLAGPAGGEEEGLLVVGAPHEESARLAGAGGGGRTTVVLVPAPVSPSGAAAAP